MSYTIRYSEDVVKKHIPNLPITARAIIKKVIEEKLSIDPVSFGKPLRYSMKGSRRLRVGDYRVIYSINFETVVVLIEAIGHRNEIYS